MPIPPGGFTDIKREPGVTTRNGLEWEVKLSRPAPAEWILAFQRSGETSSIATPGGVRLGPHDSVLLFRAHEDQVDQWLTYIDKWIPFANARYRALLDEGRRRSEEQALRDAAEAERIRKLNDRFKNR